MTLRIDSQINKKKKSIRSIDKYCGNRTNMRNGSARFRHISRLITINWIVALWIGIKLNRQVPSDSHPQSPRWDEESVTERWEQTFIFCLTPRTPDALASSALWETSSFLTMTCFTPGLSVSFTLVDLYASTLKAKHTHTHTSIRGQRKTATGFLWIFFHTLDIFSVSLRVYSHFSTKAFHIPFQWHVVALANTLWLSHPVYQAVGKLWPTKIKKNHLHSHKTAVFQLCVSPSCGATGVFHSGRVSISDGHQQAAVCAVEAHVFCTPSSSSV